MEEYIKIAQAVSRTFQRVYKHEKDDILSIAYEEAVQCYNRGCPTPLAVVSIRCKIIKYLDKNTRGLPNQYVPPEKERGLFVTLLSEDEVAKLLDFAYLGKRVQNATRPKLKELIDKFELQTLFK